MSSLTFYLRQRPSLVTTGALLLFGLTTVAVGVVVVNMPLLLLVLVSVVVIGFSMVLASEPLVLGILLLRRTLDIKNFFGFALPYASIVPLFNAAIVLVLILASMWRILSRRIALSRIPLLPQWLVLLAVAGVSIIRASDRVYALQELGRLAGQVSMYILVLTTIRSRRQAYQLLATFLLATLVPNIVGMYGVLSSSSGFADLDVPRLYGPTGSGPAHGLFLVTPMLIALALLSMSRSLWTRVAYVFVVVSMAVPFFYTLARMAWMGLFGATLVLVVLAPAGRQRRWFLLGLLMMLAVIVFVPAVSERFLALLDPSVDSSIPNRILLWRKARQLFESSPLIGAGLGAADRLTRMPAWGRGSPVHNDIVRISADMGVVGLLVYLWLYVALLRHAYATYRTLSNPLFKSIAAVTIGAWVAFQISSWGNPVFTHSVLQFQYWALAGLTLSLPIVEQLEMPDASACESTTPSYARRSRVSP